MTVTRDQIDATRQHLGPTATFREVAAVLGVGENTVRRRFTKAEIRQWTRDMRKAKKVEYLAHEAKKVKGKYLSMGRLPTAHESGVTTHAMRALGGYSKIVAAAGLVPRKPGRPKDRPLPQPPKVKHWQ